ncbi:M20/M25/M40 family metallo-hydrolase [Pseudonocardia parietis]|uniref:Aminopeptidase S n=1 Tax=Pseudonocardia parietis TaxID=570936 RepID=A0ABS4VZ73_9PSEU|nr:M20/M25/M40 family metallo-hydrolase [Pseudonocardia parietis]MBP2369239.1 aminopeptidase S [Pseudonocardia parietis]
MAAVLAVAALLLVGCTAAPPDTAPAPTADPGSVPPRDALSERLASTASGAGAVPHLEALQRIADSNGGNRASGTPGYARSVDYVAGVLRDAGFEVETPTYYDEDLGRELRNVVARTRDGNPDAVVLAGAHLDSVTAGPGINDDGTGVAAQLEIATRLGPTPGTPNTVAFGFWGSEEEGLYGSKGYVEGLSRSERGAHLLYLNSDMLGSPNGGYFVQGGVGDEESGTGPPGSATVAAVLIEELAATGATAERIPLYGDDDAPFVDAGIPTAGAVTGDGDAKSAEQAEKWGGTAGEVFDPCYHSACDTVGNVDREKLDRYTKAIAGTVGRFAVAEGRPTG